jgi:hypothetical protein
MNIIPEVAGKSNNIMSHERKCHFLFVPTDRDASSRKDFDLYSGVTRFEFQLQHG